VDVLKNRLAVILGILNVILLLVAVNSCSQRRMSIDVKHKEELKRYDAEKELNKVSGDKLRIEDSLKKLAGEMEQARTDLESAKKALLQEQLINKSLKGELEKLSKLKDALEQDLKNALVSGKSERPKK
jgi:septal ring factor EnvC (AmiA/AmiB activator)